MPELSTTLLEPSYQVRAAGMVGDLMVVFESGTQGIRDEGTKGRRCGGTTGLQDYGTTGLRTEKPGPGWNGYPVIEVQMEEWEAWVLGELYGHDGLEVVTEMLEGKGTGEKLNGHALVLAWNRTERHWHVWTNRFGTMHAYYAQSGNSAAIGTSFEAVSQVASRRELDWEALTGFFGFGFFPADRTYYTDVRLLRPATHYVFDEKGQTLSAKRYWDWWHEPDYARSYEETVQQFGELFLGVMGEMLGEKQKAKSRKLKSDLCPLTSDLCLPSSVLRPPSSPRIAIPISGGLDSRSTVAAISGQWSVVSGQWSDHLWTYSYGYSDDSVETRIAREIAKARGLPFEAFTIKPYLFERMDQVMGAVEGFQDVTQCRQAFIVDELRRNADYVIAAHWGDVWMDQMGLVGTTGLRDHGTKGRFGGRRSEVRGQKSVVSGQWSTDQLVEHTLGKMAKRGRHWLLENLCAPRLGKTRPEELLREFVAEGMRSLEGIEDPDFRVKAFKTDNWSFRWTLASIRMFQAAAFPRLPFYDTRLADFFCTVPSEYVADRRLQIDFLKKFASDLARIKWQARDADLYSLNKSPAWNVPKRAIRKAVRFISGAVLQRNWEVQFGGKGRRGQRAEGRDQRAEVRGRLMGQGKRLQQFLRREKLGELVNDFYGKWPDAGLGYTMSMLVTFAERMERG